MIRIRQINVAIDEDEKELITKCAKKLKTNKENIEEYKIVKKSIDARDKQNIVFCYEVDIKAKNEDEILRKNKSKDIFEASNTQYEFKITGKQKIKSKKYRHLVLTPLQTSSMGLSSTFLRSNSFH